jgi:hypothetical protein
MFTNHFALRLVIYVVFFWDIVTRSLAVGYQNIGGIYCLHIQCDFYFNTEAACPFET